MSTSGFILSGNQIDSSKHNTLSLTTTAHSTIDHKNTQL